MTAATRHPDLAGKVILITGAARRLGAAMAQTLHAQGASIVIHYRSAGASELAATKLAASLNGVRGDSAITAQADLADTARLPALIQRCLDGFGRLDALLNNASSFYPTPIGEITAEHWDDLFAANLKAPLFLAQAAAPELKRRQGCIVNLVDIHAVRPLKRHTVYCIAKAGLGMLTKSLARELAPEVRVNGIAPGPILWPEGNGDDAEVREEIIGRTALKRMGDPQDIARTALFLIQDAPFITGQIIAVDGGRSIGW